MAQSKLMAKLLLITVVMMSTTRGAWAQTICGSAAVSAAGTTTCNCPTGSGKITAVTTAVAVPGAGVVTTTYTATAGTSSSATVITLVATGTPAATAAQVVGICTDLIPGYAFAAGATPVAASAIGVCSTAGTYCPGASGVLAWSAGTVFATTPALVPAGPGTAAAPNIAVAGTNLMAIPCPTNTVSSSFTGCTLSAGWYQTAAASASGSPGVIATVTVCPANSYCLGGGNAATITGSTTCPSAGVGSGTATATGSTVLSNCVLTAGYYVSTYTATSGSTPASATVAVCPANSYCPGYASTASSIFLTYVVSGAGVGAVACPFVTVQGDASSNAALVGNTLIASCVLDPGYYQTAGTAVTTTALATATVAVCASNYFCVGGGTIAATVTNSNNGGSACPYATTIGDATYTQYPGTSSNAITDCFTKPGYFIVALTSVAGSGALCQVNEYCPGGFPVPAAGLVATTPGNVANDGAVGCPTTSTLAVAVAATAATANNDITDCVIPTGFYVSVKQGTVAAAGASTPVPGTLVACPAGSYCAGGAWSDVVGYGFTSILPNYVVTAVTSGVPSFLPCGTTALVASCTAAKVPWSLCTGAGTGSGAAGSDSNYLLGAACSGASSSNLLTVGYGATVTNTDYYVSAAGTVSSCPVTTCTLGQSLTTAGGASIPSGYYVSAVSGTPSAPTLQSCPTGATCAGASYANVLTLGYGVTINSGYYLSSAGVVTICPTGATCAGASSLTVGTGFAVSSGYVISAVATGVATVIACPTGAVCSGGSKIVTGTGAVTASGYYTSVASAAGAIATLTACAATDVCVAGLSLAVGASPATPIVQAIIAGSSTVSDNYYQINGTSASTAVYAVCPSSLTCLYSSTTNALCTAAAVPYPFCTGNAGSNAITGNAGTIGSGAYAKVGNYVPVAGTVAACPTGASCTGVVSLAAAGGINLAYPGYMTTGVYNGNAIAVSACPTGAVCAGDPNTNQGNDMPFMFATTLPGYYVSAVGTVSACPAGATCTGGIALYAPGGGTIMAGFYVATAGTAPALCPSGSYCPGGGNLGLAGGSFACPVNSTLTGCNDFADNAPSTVNSSPVSVAPAPVTTGAVTVTPAPVTVTPAAITVTPASQPITINVTIPAPVVSAASTRSSALVLVLAALAALAAF